MRLTCVEDFDCFTMFCAHVSGRRQSIGLKSCLIKLYETRLRSRLNSLQKELIELFINVLLDELLSSSPQLLAIHFSCIQRDCCNSSSSERLPISSCPTTQHAQQQTLHNSVAEMHQRKMTCIVITQSLPHTTEPLHLLCFGTCLAAYVFHFLYFSCFARPMHSKSWPRGHSGARRSSNCASNTPMTFIQRIPSPLPLAHLYYNVP